MRFKLPALPYSHNEISWISKETLDYHHDKHHRTYIEKTNELLAGSGFEDSSLEDIIRNAEGELLHNAAQAWNHTFYWLGMGPMKLKMYAELSQFASLEKAIVKSFGSVDNFKADFTRDANQLFGSGWVWLVQEDRNGLLRLLSTQNEGNPIQHELKPLLACDVWEHAYYLDFKNNRASYIDSFVKSIDWNFVYQNFEAPEVCDLTGLMTGNDWDFAANRAQVHKSTPGESFTLHP